MNKFVLASVLAMALLSFGQNKASAGIFDFGGHNGCGYGCGGHGCGHGGHHCGHCGNGRCGICALLHSNCPGPIPGPWYQYWPDASGNMVGPAYDGRWTLERHFEVPAPLGGNPYFPAPVAAYPGYGH